MTIIESLKPSLMGSYVRVALKSNLLVTSPLRRIKLPRLGLLRPLLYAQLLIVLLVNVMETIIRGKVFPLSSYSAELYRQRKQ